MNSDVYTIQRIHEDMIAAFTLTLGTWSVINAMRDDSDYAVISGKLHIKHQRYDTITYHNQCVASLYAYLLSRGNCTPVATPVCDSP